MYTSYSPLSSAFFDGWVDGAGAAAVVVVAAAAGVVSLVGAVVALVAVEVDVADVVVSGLAAM